jgi:hypothetical protein
VAQGNQNPGGRRRPATTFKVYKRRHPQATRKDYVKHLQKLVNRGPGQRNQQPRAQGDYNQDTNTLLAALAPMAPGDIESHAMDLVGQLFGGQEQQINQGYQQAMLASGGVGSSGGAALEAGNTLAGLLAPLAGQVGGYYSQAIGQQTAADQALVNQLQTGAAEVGGSIAQQLASAGLPTDVGMQVGQTGADSAGTLQAIDSAGLTALRQQGAAAQSYAASLPGLAQMQGKADAAMFNAQAGREASARNAEIAMQQAAATSELQGQKASSILEMISQMEGREFDKAVTRLTFDESIRKLRQEAGQFKAGLRENARDRTFKAAESQLDRELAITKMMQDLDISRAAAAARVDAARILAEDEDADQAAAAGEERAGNRAEQRQQTRTETIATANAQLKNWSQSTTQPVLDAGGNPTGETREVPGSHKVKRADAVRQLNALFKQNMPWMSASKRSSLISGLIAIYYGPSAGSQSPQQPGAGPGPG